MWLLSTHGGWLADSLVIDQCLRVGGRQGGGEWLEVKWSKLARLAAYSEACEYDIAVALAACELAGDYSPGGPPLEPAEPYSRRGIFERDGWRCVYCGADTDETIDHVVPRALGGATSWGNCVTACRPCNQRKDCKTLADLGWQLPPAVRGWDLLGAWTAQRIDVALGRQGRALLSAAQYRRAALADRMADAVDAVADAAREALGLADGEAATDWDREILARVVNHLWAGQRTRLAEALAA